MRGSQHAANSGAREMTGPADCPRKLALFARLGLSLLSIALVVIPGNVRAAESKSVQIKLDQIGYLPESPKLAMVTTQGRTFEVKRVSDNSTAFKGELGPASQDADTGDSVQVADFSNLTESGIYYLDVPRVGKSWAFSIRPDVFSRTYYLAMRAFYGQRCGTAVDLGAEFQGYVHARCHLKGE